jgi:protein O-GlcNAc transferase
MYDNVSPIDAQLERAVALHREGRLAEARVNYEAVLRVQPRTLRAVRLLGGILMQTGRADLAVDLLTRALLSDPQDVGLYIMCGAAQLELGEYQAVVASSERAIALKADATDAHFNRGNALLQLQRYEAAIASFDRVLAVDARNPWAWNNRGIALYELERHADAIESYDRALALAPDNADAHYNRGNALRGLKRWEAAVADYEAAISRNSNYESAHLNRGTTLLDLKRHREAIESYDRVIAINPRNTEAHSNRGAALFRSGRAEAALESFDRVIALNPDLADAHFNRGNALRELKQYALAVESYDRAISKGSSGTGLLGLRLNSKTQICDWGGLDAGIESLAAAILRGEPASDPFFVLSLSDSARLQRDAAEVWVRATVPPGEDSPIVSRSKRPGKIRVGYFSNDFRDHPVAILSAGLFECHDRSAFEVTAFALGPAARDAMRLRLERGFDRFIELGSMSDSEGARLTRSMEIDIAVDLSGFTAGARPGIFAARAAPLQVAFLGYTGTMGASFIDYLLADHTIIPADHRCHYTEKIVYLPQCFQVNDSKRQMSGKVFSRADLGLPASAFVFCCFNNTSKIMPGSFDSWMRILAQVDDSVLWLLEDNAQAANNLRREAVARGVSGERLIFARRAPLPEHLARHRCADLFLDSLPYNAHTTASDALWAGLPVLTRLGGAFSGRVAASLLRAIDLPELITSTREQYEKLAVELATDPQRLERVKRRLAENRLTKPLFDTRLFARGIESAYRTIFERYHAGLPAAHIGAGPE